MSNIDMSGYNDVASRMREFFAAYPAGDFDACTRSVDGSYRVYAWYVGDGGVQ